MTAELVAMRESLLNGPTTRWAVLAPGEIAHDFTRTLHQNSTHRVVAVGSRSRERAQSFGAEFGVDGRYDTYEAAVADPTVDAVYVAAPNAFHRDLALLAIAAGKHVLVEKPLAMNASEAREIAVAARASKVFVMEAMWTRYLPHSIVITELIRRGSLGDIRLATADVGWRVPPETRDHKIFSPELGGGTLLDMGVYALWFAQFAIGHLSELRAVGSISESGVDEQIAAVLRSGPGRHAAITASMTVTNSGHASVHGTAGSIECLDYFVFPSRLRIRTDNVIEEWVDDSGLRGRQGLVWQAAAFADYLSEGRLESPLHTMADSIALAETMDEVRRQILPSHHFV